MINKDKITDLEFELEEAKRTENKPLVADLEYQIDQLNIMTDVMSEQRMK